MANVLYRGEATPAGTVMRAHIQLLDGTIVVKELTAEQEVQYHKNRQVLSADLIAGVRQNTGSEDITNNAEVDLTDYRGRRRRSI